MLNGVFKWSWVSTFNLNKLWSSLNVECRDLVPLVVLGL